MVSVRVVDALATRELRRAVLRPTWPAGSPMHGDDDASAVHLAVLDGDEVIGACVLLRCPYPLHPERPDSWQLRGMAIAPGRQGQGIGGHLLLAALREVAVRGGSLVWCDARTSALGFYRRHGFVAEGAQFRHEETGIPHFRMYRELAGAATAS